MSQESRTKWNTKIFFFSSSVTSFSCLEWTGYAPTLWKLNPGSTVSYSAVWVYPLWLFSRGWSSPAILPPQDQTENLMVKSPTLQPLNHVVDEISCQNVSIYAQGILNYQGNLKIQNFKICKDQESNSGQDLLVVCVTRRLIPLDHVGLLFSAQIWKYKLERTWSCQSYKF